MFNYNSKGVKPSNMSGPIPEGEYVLQITNVEEKLSSNGYPMVKIVCSVEGPTEKGATVFHNVTFLPSGSPGAGIAIHFLKTIGEPYEELEQLGIDPDNWMGRKFRAKVIRDDYRKPDGTVITNNKIKGVESISEVNF